MNFAVKLTITKRFAVYDVLDTQASAATVAVVCLVNCSYTESVLLKALARRPFVRVFHDFPKPALSAQMKTIQFGDFENIDWEPVMSGSHMASSYLVRKGLSRKAQLALQIKRFLSKHPKSILKQTIPFTLIIETWNAFEDMRFDFGGGFLAKFDASNLVTLPLRDKMEWSLEDVKAEMEKEERSGWKWILKPSVTNKGIDISIVCDFNGLLDALVATPDMREWVLQRYVDRPLTLGGHKFHLRVYVLCVGALKVYVYDRILALLAAHRYDADDLEDIYKHLTNTARAAEDVEFDEIKFVKLLEDLPEYLLRERPDLAPTAAQADACMLKIREDVHDITKELFSAFENEYTVFAPMSNCFELFGLDFLVAEDCSVSLLEVNPGPDFKQTGGRLKTVIEGLLEQTVHLSIDPLGGEAAPVSGGAGSPDMTLVYDNEWSASRLQGGMKFK